MQHPTDEQIAAALVPLMADAFNRSLGALEEAGAIDCRRLRAAYTGIGSRYYDLVTKQLELTAKYSAPAIRRLFSSSVHSDQK